MEPHTEHSNLPKQATKTIHAGCSSSSAQTSFYADVQEDETRREGLPYCKYFKWVEDDQYQKSNLGETHNELVRTKKKLEKILDDIEKSKIDLRKRADEIEMREMTLSSRNEEVVNKELALVVSEAEIRRSRTLLRVYWAAAFVVACYLSCK